VAPQTETQKVLAEIWKEVLGIEQVGIHDNFFDLGGHSLMATQVVSRVRQTFGMELLLQSLFKYPNVATLAEEIETMLIVAKDVLQSVGEGSAIQQEDEEKGEL
ncbi:phosphopantetheine-binding protein, partial [Moorena sp. SIO3B2]|uniref:phosphopantetheine-binding protein n=1 Tax=Moorena sp. SIO3B2 TaxID=2607827 RepID=UPI0013C9FAC0